MSEKAASDTAAYARTLAVARHRNGTLAADAVLESRAFTDQEGHTATPLLVDVVAADLNALLAALDGRRMLWTPGAIAPGVIGGICLLPAFFAFQVLPVNTSGVLLVVMGVALLVLGVKVPSFGVLGIGGVVALAAGSVMLTRAVPGVHISYRLLIPMARRRRHCARVGPTRRSGTAAHANDGCREHARRASNLTGGDRPRPVRTGGRARRNLASRESKGCGTLVPSDLALV